MKDTRIGFRVSEEEKELLVQLAQKKDISISQLIREAIAAYIKLKEEQKND